MSETTNTDDQLPEGPTDNVELPMQASPQDTTNWDDRQFNTPSGRVVIETDQTKEDDTTTVAE